MNAPVFDRDLAVDFATRPDFDVLINTRGPGYFLTVVESRGARIGNLTTLHPETRKVHSVKLIFGGSTVCVVDGDGVWPHSLYPHEVDVLVREEVPLDQHVPIRGRNA